MTARVLDPAKIAIRELTTLAEYQACVELQEETWGHGFLERVPAAILRVSQKIGGVTAGAFDENDRLIGFVFGMTGVRDGALAHWSDMLAVREDAQGRNIGRQLKAYQRARVLALGVRTMFWTYDPLVARNAHFNINRLGARPVEYVPDMYGSNTGSTLHGAVATDRFVVAWQLDGAEPPRPDAGQACPGDDAIPMANPLTPASDGLPTPAEHTGALSVRVQVPRDPAEIGDEARRSHWRLCVRAAIEPRMASGYRVTRFVRSTDRAVLPYYVLDRA